MCVDVHKSYFVGGDGEVKKNTRRNVACLK